MNIVLFAGIFLIFFFATPHIQLKNFSLINTDNLFLPYGVILFALAGWPAIPEIVDFFTRKHEKRNIDNVIVIAGVIIIALYLAFSLFVVGVSGSATSPDALQGLIPFLGKGVIVLGSVLGLTAIAASFLILGNYLKNSLRYDFHFPYIFSAGISIIAPLLLFLIGFQEFILVLSIVGLIAVIDGVLIVALFLKVKNKGTREPEYELRIPRFLPYLVAIVLIGGAIVELLSFL
jgi:tyrosine-specific transport protein